MKFAQNLGVSNILSERLKWSLKIYLLKNKIQKTQFSLKLDWKTKINRKKKIGNIVENQNFWSKKDTHNFL